jgi:hypothetical protein
MKSDFMDEETKKFLESFEKRIKILEEKILIKKEIPKSKEFIGLSGGIRFLIRNGFLETPKSLEEIKKEMDRENYYYPYSSISKILGDFVTKKILTRFKEADVWRYVVRK